MVLKIYLKNQSCLITFFTIIRVFYSCDVLIFPFLLIIYSMFCKYEVYYLAFPGPHLLMFLFCFILALTTRFSWDHHSFSHTINCTKFLKGYFCLGSANMDRGFPSWDFALALLIFWENSKALFAFQAKWKDIFKCGCWQMITDKKHHCVSQDKLYFLSAPASHLQAWQYVRKIDHFSDRKPHRLLSQRAAIKSSLWASCVYSLEISHCKYLVQKEHNVSTRPHNLYISQIIMHTFDWKKKQLSQRELILKVSQLAEIKVQCSM